MKTWLLMSFCLLMVFSISSDAVTISYGSTHTERHATSWCSNSSSLANTTRLKVINHTWSGRSPLKKYQQYYQTLIITQPQMNETIRHNDGTLTIQLSVKPTLRKKDSIRYYLDGKLIATSHQSKLLFSPLYRGTHQLQAAIINNQKKVLKQSKKITFYYHHTFKKR